MIEEANNSLRSRYVQHLNRCKTQWEKNQENGDRTLHELHSLQQRYMKLRGLIDESINETNVRFNLSRNNLSRISLSCDDLDPQSQISNDTLVEKYFQWFMQSCLDKNFQQFSKFKNFMTHCYRELYDPLFTNVLENDIKMYYINELNNTQLSQHDKNHIIRFAQATAALKCFTCEPFKIISRSRAGDLVPEQSFNSSNAKLPNFLATLSLSKGKASDWKNRLVIAQHLQEIIDTFTNNGSNNGNNGSNNGNNYQSAIAGLSMNNNDMGNVANRGLGGLGGLITISQPTYDEHEMIENGSRFGNEHHSGEDRASTDDAVSTGSGNVSGHGNRNGNRHGTHLVPGPLSMHSSGNMTRGSNESANSSGSPKYFDLEKVKTKQDLFNLMSLMQEIQGGNGNGMDEGLASAIRSVQSFLVSQPSQASQASQPQSHQHQQYQSSYQQQQPQQQAQAQMIFEEHGQYPRSHDFGTQETEMVVHTGHTQMSPQIVAPSENGTAIVSLPPSNHNGGLNWEPNHNIPQVTTSFGRNVSNGSNQDEPFTQMGYGYSSVSVGIDHNNNNNNNVNDNNSNHNYNNYNYNNNNHNHNINNNNNNNNNNTNNSNMTQYLPQMQQQTLGQQLNQHQMFQQQSQHREIQYSMPPMQVVHSSISGVSQSGIPGWFCIMCHPPTLNGLNRRTCRVCGSFRVGSDNYGNDNNGNNNDDDNDDDNNNNNNNNNYRFQSRNYLNSANSQFHQNQGYGATRGSQRYNSQNQRFDGRQFRASPHGMDIIIDDGTNNESKQNNNNNNNNNQNSNNNNNHNGDSPETPRIVSGTHLTTTSTHDVTSIHYLHSATEDSKLDHNDNARDSATPKSVTGLYNDRNDDGYRLIWQKYNFFESKWIDIKSQHYSILEETQNMLDDAIDGFVKGTKIEKLGKDRARATTVSNSIAIPLRRICVNGHNERVLFEKSWENINMDLEREKLRNKNENEKFVSWSSDEILQTCRLHSTMIKSAQENGKHAIVKRSESSRTMEKLGVPTFGNIVVTPPLVTMSSHTNSTTQHTMTNNNNNNTSNNRGNGGMNGMIGTTMSSNNTYTKDQASRTTYNTNQSLTGNSNISVASNTGNASNIMKNYDYLLRTFDKSLTIAQGKIDPAVCVDYWEEGEFEKAVSDMMIEGGKYFTKLRRCRLNCWQYGKFVLGLLVGLVAAIQTAACWWYCFEITFNGDDEQNLLNIAYILIMFIILFYDLGILKSGNVVETLFENIKMEIIRPFWNKFKHSLFNPLYDSLLDTGKDKLLTVVKKTYDATALEPIVEPSSVCSIFGAYLAQLVSKLIQLIAVMLAICVTASIFIVWSILCSIILCLGSSLFIFIAILMILMRCISLLLLLLFNIYCKGFGWSFAMDYYLFRWAKDVRAFVDYMPSIHSDDWQENGMTTFEEAMQSQILSLDNNGDDSYERARTLSTVSVRSNDDGAGGGGGSSRGAATSGKASGTARSDDGGWKFSTNAVFNKLLCGQVFQAILQCVLLLFAKLMDGQAIHENASNSWIFAMGSNLLLIFLFIILLLVSLRGKMCSKSQRCHKFDHIHYPWYSLRTIE